MKTLVKRTLLYWVVLVAVLAIALGVYSIVVPHRSDPLVGTWVDGDKPIPSCVLDFRPNHICWLFVCHNNPSFDYTSLVVGTYQVTGNRIDLTIPSRVGNQTFFLEYSLSGDILTVELAPSLQGPSEVTVLHRVGK